MKKSWRLSLIANKSYPVPSHVPFSFTICLSIAGRIKQTHGLLLSGSVAFWINLERVQRRTRVNRHVIRNQLLILSQINGLLSSKQYTAASTVSYNSQPYGAKNMYHQQVYSQQLPSSTDNSTVGVPPFMPGGVGCGGGVGSSIILPTPSPSHQMVQSRHQAPPASPAARNGVFSM